MREAAYVRTSKDVGKWQQVVLQNRRAEQLVFPLKQEIPTVVPLEQVASAWKVGAVTQLPGVGWGSSTSGCAGRSEGGMRKAQLVAEALGAWPLSLGRLKGKPSVFLACSRCVNALWERPGKASAEGSEPALFPHLFLASQP